MLAKGGNLGFPPFRIPPSTRYGELLANRPGPDAARGTWKTSPRSHGALLARRACPIPWVKHGRLDPGLTTGSTCNPRLAHHGRSLADAAVGRGQQNWTSAHYVRSSGSALTVWFAHRQVPPTSSTFRVRQERLCSS